MPEREIVDAVDLCLPDGRLNPDAVGWSRTPLHGTALRGWGRSKRWEYWGVLTPTHMVGVTVSSLDYAGVESIYVLDRASGSETVRETVVPLARGVELPERCGEGRASVHAGGLRIVIDERPDASRVRATARDVEIDLLVARPEGRESLSVVVPWSARRFQYTVKDVGRPVAGRITLDGVGHDVGDGAFAVLDHGRGRWPYSMTWNWGAGHRGAGTDVAVQLGGRWTDGTGSTENALILDGVLHKESADLRWTYDRADWLRPWRIVGGGTDLTFHPEHDRVARTNLLVVANETHQCFGTWTGWMTTDSGDRVVVDGATGWAEEARNRW